MIARWPLVLAPLLIGAPAQCQPSVRTLLANAAAEASAMPPPVLEGPDGWLHLAANLRHLSHERYWGDAAARVSRAMRKEWADPLPAILDFHEQLQAAGVELLVVPVPAKAATRPASVEGLAAAAAGARVDATDADFFKRLRAEGVEVLDLVPLLEAAQETAGSPAHCRTDTHWSGVGVEAAAHAIAQRLARVRPRGRAPLIDLASERREIEILGDLAAMLGNTGRERITLRFVGTRAGNELRPLAPDRDSPVLVLGDSHALVFHAGADLHAAGAGLPDQLALELGFPVDLVAVRGSGATPARLALLRRGDGLAGKQAIVWVFATRELTESAQGWRPLPISR